MNYFSLLPGPLRPEAYPLAPAVPLGVRLRSTPPPPKTRFSESPPPGRSALSLRVRAASRKPGSGARQVAVSQLSSVSLSNHTCGLQSPFLSIPSLSFASDSKSLRPYHHPQQVQTSWWAAKGCLHFALKSLWSRFQLFVHRDAAFRSSFLLQTMYWPHWSLCPSYTAYSSLRRGGFISSAAPASSSRHLAAPTTPLPERPRCLPGPGILESPPRCWDPPPCQPLCPLVSSGLCFCPVGIVMLPRLVSGEVTCASHVTAEVLPSQIPAAAAWLLREPGFEFSRHPCK